MRNAFLCKHVNELCNDRRNVTARPRSSRVFGNTPISG
jgi:hypothetical protein